MEVCKHFDELNPEIVLETPETTKGCFECLKINGRWVHLRQCMTCGIVHCCDSSPNQHATKHFQLTKHPIMQILENTYQWCFIDEMAIEMK